MGVLHWFLEDSWHWNWYYFTSVSVILLGVDVNATNSILIFPWSLVSCPCSFHSFGFFVLVMTLQSVYIGCQGLLSVLSSKNCYNYGNFHFVILVVTLCSYLSSIDVVWMVNLHVCIVQKVTSAKSSLCQRALRGKHNYDFISRHFSAVL